LLAEAVGPDQYEGRLRQPLLHHHPRLEQLLHALALDDRTDEHGDGLVLRQIESRAQLTLLAGVAHRREIRYVHALVDLADLRRVNACVEARTLDRRGYREEAIGQALDHTEAQPAELERTPEGERVVRTEQRHLHDDFLAQQLREQQEQQEAIMIGVDVD